MSIIRITMVEMILTITQVLGRQGIDMDKVGGTMVKGLLSLDPDQAQETVIQFPAFNATSL